MVSVDVKHHVYLLTYCFYSRQTLSADLSEEREFLAEVAYPELKKFCEKQGLGCHVVDLRHGTSRLKNSRETFDVIQRELFKCQKYSIGPCFVVSIVPVPVSE